MYKVNILLKQPSMQLPLMVYAIIQDEYGSISTGKWANINLINELTHMVFSPLFGVSHINKTMLEEMKLANNEKNKFNNRMCIYL